MSTTTSRHGAATQTTPVTASDVGLLPLRVVFGLGLAAHGTQKLFGWFGGGGIAGTGQGFQGMGFSPGAPIAAVAGVVEVAGGLALVAGLLTPLACAGIAATMFGATAAVWAGSGAYFKADGGMEYELLLAAAGLALALTGPGRIALDHGRPWLQDKFRYAAFGLGLALGLLALLVRAV
ncbi:MAG: DoxX family membrane protein [Streptosporangiales bacterium]|nr:DoxX family membrane protein [Streptosporangiales bacterium]